MYTTLSLVSLLSYSDFPTLPRKHVLSFHMLRHRNVFEKHCGSHWARTKILKQELSHYGIRNILEGYHTHLHLIYQGSSERKTRAPRTS